MSYQLTHAHHGIRHYKYIYIIDSNVDWNIILSSITSFLEKKLKSQIYTEF